jgi:hypothetical protein
MRVNTHKYMSDTPIYAHIYVRYTNIRAHTHTRSGSDDGAIMSKKHSRFPSSPFTAATAVFALLPPRACPRRRHSEEEAEGLACTRDTCIYLNVSIYEIRVCIYEIRVYIRDTRIYIYEIRVYIRDTRIYISDARI